VRAAEVKKCDVLLMECTFGRPQYVFPSRAEIEERIVEFATAHSATAARRSSSPIRSVRLKK